MTEKLSNANLDKPEDEEKTAADNPEPAKQESKKSNLNVPEKKESVVETAPGSKKSNLALPEKKESVVETEKPEDATKKKSETKTPDDAPKEIDKEEPAKPGSRKSSLKVPEKKESKVETAAGSRKSSLKVPEKKESKVETAAGSRKSSLKAPEKKESKVEAAAGSRKSSLKVPEKKESVVETEKPEDATKKKSETKKTDDAPKEIDKEEPAKQGSRKSSLKVTEKKESVVETAPEIRKSNLDVPEQKETVVETEEPEDATKMKSETKMSDDALKEIDKEEPAKQRSRKSSLKLPAQKTSVVETKEIDKTERVKLEVTGSAEKVEKSDETQRKEIPDTRFEKRDDLPKTDTSKMSKQELELVSSRLKVRKYSYGYGSVSGLRRQDGFSAQGIEYKRPFLIYEPTYQLEPIIPFKSVDVEKIINRILDSVYGPYVYHDETSPGLAVSIANTVMRETKALHFNRYRILSVVTIGQNRKQSYTNAVSFLWDKDRDNYADVERETYSTFIQVTVFGIYLD